MPAPNPSVVPDSKEPSTPSADTVEYLTPDLGVDRDDQAYAKFILRAFDADPSSYWLICGHKKWPAEDVKKPFLSTKDYPRLCATTKRFLSAFWSTNGDRKKPRTRIPRDALEKACLDGFYIGEYPAFAETPHVILDDDQGGTLPYLSTLVDNGVFGNANSRIPGRRHLRALKGYDKDYDGKKWGIKPAKGGWLHRGEIKERYVVWWHPEQELEAKQTATAVLLDKHIKVLKEPEEQTAKQRVTKQEALDEYVDRIRNSTAGVDRHDVMIRGLARLASKFGHSITRDELQPAYDAFMATGGAKNANEFWDEWPIALEKFSNPLTQRSFLSNAADDVAIALDTLGFKGQFDEFTQQEMVQLPDSDEWVQLTDKEVVTAHRAIQRQWRGGTEDRPTVWNIGVENLRRNMQLMAWDNPIHSPRQYLAELPEWDGVPRLDTLFSRFYDIAPPPTVDVRDDQLALLLPWVNSSFLLGIVTQIRSPGAKNDAFVTWVGRGGAGKGTAAALLMPHNQWFIQGFRYRPNDKDTEQALIGKLAIEYPELDTLRGRQVESFKGFIGRETFTMRVAYGRTVDNYPFTTVFIATANRLPSWTDTLNRRAIPVVATAKKSLRHTLSLDDMGVPREGRNKTETQFVRDLENFDQLDPGEQSWLEGTISLNYLKAWIPANRDQLWAEAKYRVDVERDYGVLTGLLEYVGTRLGAAMLDSGQYAEAVKKLGEDVIAGKTSDCWFIIGNLRRPLTQAEVIYALQLTMRQSSDGDQYDPAIKVSKSVWEAVRLEMENQGWKVKQVRAPGGKSPRLWHAPHIDEAELRASLKAQYTAHGGILLDEDKRESDDSPF